MAAIHRQNATKIAAALKAARAEVEAGVRPKKRRLADGNNLCLQVRGGSAVWLFRWEERGTGREREMSLGSYAVFSLEAARQKAAYFAQMLHEGKDPKQERDGAREDAAHARHVDRTVRQVGEEWFDNFLKRGFSKTYTADKLRSLRHMYLTIGDMRIQKVDRSVILAKTGIKEIWFTKKQAGWRLQQTGREIWDWAKGHGYYRGENPWTYDGAFEKILPPGVHQIEKHRSLPANEFPAFMERLRRFRYGRTFAKKMDLPREDRPMAALMAEFTILNGARIGEVRQARWNELDPAECVWRVPKAHLKNGRYYEQSPGLTRPLTPEMMALLDEAGRRSNRPPDGAVFRPTGSPGKPPTELFSDTSINTFWKNTFRWKGSEFDIHGFRTNIEDWRRRNAGTFPEEWIEIQTDHPPKGKRRKSYYADELLAERRIMMECVVSILCAARTASSRRAGTGPFLSESALRPAKTLGRSERSIKDMIARGQIEAIKSDRRTLVLVQSLKDYVASRPKARGTPNNYRAKEPAFV